ncbi:MAG TPA: hypothetical protein VI299_02525, partial [Polyangiales bacterium]
NAMHTAQHTAATARRGTTGSGTALSPAAGIPSGVPTVGDSWRLNVELNDACSTGTATTATVRVVGTKCIIVTDDANPAGGPPTSGGINGVDLQTVDDACENAIYPSITGLYGTPTDLDNNGRVVLFYTAAVNRLAATAEPNPLWALHLTRDLLSQTECPTSNVGEVIYMMAGDPTGTINSNVRTNSSVIGTTEGHGAHELGHLVLDARRLINAAPFNEAWLDEGLAGEAQERSFYGFTSWRTPAAPLIPLLNIQLSTLNTGAQASIRVAGFNTFQNYLFQSAGKPWLQAPGNVGLANTTTNLLAQRGASWLFLRYAADRYAAGSSTQEAAFFNNLANGSRTGTNNLLDVIGSDPTLWMRDFLASVYIDDSAIANLDVAGLPYRTSSWNFRSVWGGLGGFPLQLPTLTNNVAANLNLGAGGGANYIRIVVNAATAGQLALTPPASGSWDAWYMVLRRN